MQFSLIIPWFPENIYFKQLFIGVRTMSEQLDIIYTKVDEAPQLASGSFLPIIQSFTEVAGIRVGTKDISLAGRIISQFPERLQPEQQQPDDLALLGEMVLTPEANVIKLPNISASIPQIKGAVEELQSRGYNGNQHPQKQFRLEWGVYPQHQVCPLLPAQRPSIQRYEPPTSWPSAPGHTA